MRSCAFPDRRQFLRTAATALGGCAAAGGQAGSRPNIVLIVADDLGYGHLGCYGQKKIRTPNLDRMAEEGTRFTQFYSGACVCAPSRCSLMTGLTAGHCSVRGNSGGIPLLPDDVTIASLLQRAGYRTGIFGKWGLGEAGTTGVPGLHGFDESYGYLHQMHAHFYYPHFLWHNGRKEYLNGNRSDYRKQYSHDLIEEQALRFVEQPGGQPFFAYLPFTIPHAELLAPEEAVQEYLGQFPETPFTSKPRMHYAPNPAPKATIAAMITRLDRTVGRVFEALRKIGAERNTLVLFTSDNGPDALNGNDVDFFESAGPLRGHKFELYEGGMRVPLIAWWPGAIPAGQVRDTVWAFWDVLPTLCEFAGVAPPKQIDGLSHASMLRGANEPENRHEFLYWEVSDPDLQQAVRMGYWKAIRHKPEQPLELYQLDADPKETRNVADGHPEVVARIEAYLRTARRPPPPQTEPPSMDGRKFR